MTAERWQQVKAIFDRAVECDLVTRAAFIRERCGSDQELLREVESLLASDQDASSLLEHPVLPGGVAAGVAPSSASRQLVGRQVGNYIITGELARGGMGIVYRGRHVTLPRDVVVKCIRPIAFSEDAREELRIRFRREAHIQSQLDHAHIVRIHEFFVDIEEYFLVMEYVHGQSLRTMLDQDRVLPVAQAVAFAIQALDGLGYAHNLRFVDESGNTGVGIIHRDIKPGNLLVDEHGNLKITDFGIAKLLGETHGTKTGLSPGTVEYMSPEQVRSLAVDPRSDLYSLGVTLYEALSGRVPFERTSLKSDFDVLNAHIKIYPTPIRTLNPGIPLSLAEIVTRSLKKDPDQRWQTAAEFREALISFQQNRSIAVSTGTARPSKAPSGAKRKLLAGALVLLLAVVATVAGLFWLGRSGKSSQPVSDQPSIAVLPFADMSPERNQEYLCESLAEELRNGLAKTPGLRVAGRISSFQFKGKAQDPRVIGQKLKVATILDGSVRTQGNRSRIAVQLIQAADGAYLWSETYNRELNDVFAVQEEIALAVTGALKVTLFGKKAAAPNAEAYNAYLEGRYFLARGRTKENLEKAVRYFEQAIRLDPGYAPAWVGLGKSRNDQADWDYVPAERGYPEALEDVERALRLDAGLGEAHAIRGSIQQNYAWDWTRADASYRRALALEPGNTIAIGGSGSLAWVQGRLDEAIGLYRRASEIDPLNPTFYYNSGLVLDSAGRQDEAAAAFRKALELTPEMENAHALLCRVHLMQSRPQEALAEAEKEKHPVSHLWGLALAYHASGRKKESDANLSEMIAKFHEEAPYMIADVYAFRGEADRAFEWMGRAYTSRDSGVTEMKGDPLLKSLRRDPRFTALLQKMRLPL